MTAKLKTPVADEEIAAWATLACFPAWTGFMFDQAKNKLFKTPRPVETKNLKKSERFPSLVRIPMGDRQNASCRMESMGAVRLAITTIAGLTDLFCVEPLSASSDSRAMSV